MPPGFVPDGQQGAPGPQMPQPVIPPEQYVINQPAPVIPFGQPAPVIPGFPQQPPVIPPMGMGYQPTPIIPPMSGFPMPCLNLSFREAWVECRVWVDQLSHSIRLRHR